MRTTARETVFKILFSFQFIDGVEENFSKALYSEDKLTDSDIEYCNRVLSIVKEHRQELTDLIDEHSKIYPEARIFAADKSILYLALAEILYMDDIPDPVSANEAANIASKYSTDKSASFVSGILSEIIKEKKDV